MKITLETVMQILREALGFESFVASFITKVKEDKNVKTACITKHGMLSYNPEFVSKFISSKQDLFSLIFHELLHPMFGHFIYTSGEIENIAADAIINAVISEIYSDNSRNGTLFRKLYNPKGINGLLRAQSNMGNSRYEKVYDKLYSQNQNSSCSITTGELIQTLKILTETENLKNVFLLGSHNKENSLNGLSSEELGRIAADIKKSVSKKGKNAGFSEDLFSILIQALRTHISIKKALLQKFITKRKIDRFKELFRQRRISVSPIPLNPSKRDLVMLSSGIYPFYFHNRIQTKRKQNRGLAIYLDVSGSVNEFLPKIIGILQSLKNEITSIFLFSNKVIEVTFDTLLKGNIQTSYGTDFDCVAESILEKCFDRAVIITDGYATMKEGLKKKLEIIKLKTICFLFNSGEQCEAWEYFGDVVQLEDICVKGV